MISAAPELDLDPFSPDVLRDPYPDTSCCAKLARVATEDAVRRNAEAHIGGRATGGKLPQLGCSGDRCRSRQLSFNYSNLHLLSSDS